MALSGFDQDGNCTTTNSCWREHADSQSRPADNHCESDKETDDTKDTDNAPMSDTPVNDGRDASHIKSTSSLDDTSGARQRLKFDGVASGMTPDPRRKSDSRENLEMAARVQSRWKRWSRTTGLMNMARCLRDYIARWNQIWIRRLSGGVESPAGISSCT